MNPVHHHRQLRAADVQLYTACEHVTEVVVYFMVVFSPWAFGTTQPWSIRTMNVAGYLLGALLIAKIVIRRWKGYVPPRWGDEPSGGSQAPSKPKGFSVTRLTRALALLTMTILAYCAVSAMNAAAAHDPEGLTFDYYPHLAWLPHSFDRARTWSAFRNYLALACAFWALIDWLPGRSGGEERAARQAATGRPVSAPLLPARLRRLLWVLCVNGALVGMEGIAQRIEGSGRLLFLIKPQVNPEAVSQFGPFHYRANASAYFNLIWPVGLGFWWMLQCGARSGEKGHHLLLGCSLIIAACPIISTSRGGALVTLAMVMFAGLLLIATHFFVAVRRQGDGRQRRMTPVFLIFFISGVLVLGYALGWKALEPRLTRLHEGFDSREGMYDLARPMAADYPLFGTGPGTFESVFQLYRISTETYWPAQLHNDWLETRITFGWMGSFLIALALVITLSRWFASGGLHGGRRFMMLLWLAMAGCLAHARFDFPFQIYSTVFLFVVLCALAFSLSRRP